MGQYLKTLKLVLLWVRDLSIMVVGVVAFIKFVTGVANGVYDKPVAELSGDDVFVLGFVITVMAIMLMRSE